MAKKSMVEREKKRLKLHTKYNLKRVKLERLKMGFGLIHILSCTAFTFGLLYVIIQVE